MDLETRLPPGDAAALPAVPGAYVLLIRLRSPCRLRVGAMGDIDFEPGFYFYMGSARGPGGIGARVRRHLRRRKPHHWHIDRLTKAGEVVGVLTHPDGNECNLVETARRLGGVSAPVPGFGSSDCKSCVSHLLKADGAPAHSVASLAKIAGMSALFGGVPHRH